MKAGFAENLFYPVSKKSDSVGPIQQFKFEGSNNDNENDNNNSNTNQMFC